MTLEILESEQEGYNVTDGHGIVTRQTRLQGDTGGDLSVYAPLGSSEAVLQLQKRCCCCLVVIANLVTLTDPSNHHSTFFQNPWGSLSVRPGIQG